MPSQVDGYKYLLWVPGNCASLRMAAQLLSDAAVLKLDSPEIEWYYPLLQPWVHYIPVRCDLTITKSDHGKSWLEPSLYPW